jgi:hypothetical protein
VLGLEERVVVVSDLLVLEEATACVGCGCSNSCGCGQGGTTLTWTCHAADLQLLDSIHLVVGLIHGLLRAGGGRVIVCSESGTTVVVIADEMRGCCRIRAGCWFAHCGWCTSCGCSIDRPWWRHVRFVA